jgi:asparagine synthase (glutamine-hydrolysing)
VILRSYEQWGERCVERFNGMWAFALWDGRRGRLFCSRDRFGIKPFYYSWDGKRLLFASEPKAFRGVLPLQANPAAVRAYLEQGYLDHSEQTFFERIRRLPPAHNLILDRDGLRLHRYWRLQPHDPPAGDPVEAVRETFLDAVRLHLRSDVPVGTCLSGGIDSSAIVVAVDHLLQTEHATAAAVGERQQTFTAYFPDPGCDERPYATSVVEQTTVHPHWITFTDHELVHDLETIVENQDEPFGSTSMIAQWYVLRQAKTSGLTVMLDGQGGDEIFAGYRAHAGYFLAELLARGRLQNLRREFGALREVHGGTSLVIGVARAFSPEQLTSRVRGRARKATPLLHPDLRRAHPLAEPGPSTNGWDGRFRRYQALLLQRRGLPELLRYEDRNSMAHSLEARVPFLDVRLVELAFALEMRELISDGESKSILRRALHDLLPQAVRTRRDKLGFVTPEQRFFRGELGKLAADVFASSAFSDRGFSNAPAARRHLAEHRSGRRNAGMELWRTLNLELWARRFL